MENKLQSEPPKVTWETEEFPHHSKGPVWYVAFTIISAALLIYGFLSRDILTIVIFLLMVILVFAFSHRQPRLVMHQLTPQGIVLGDTIFPYKNIKSFWIVYEPPTVKTLNIETSAYLNSHVTIQLGEVDPMEVKNYLKKYVVEDLDRDESLVDIISRNLRL